MNKIYPNTRVSSIDVLRGLVMVIMALDHVREFFHAEALQKDPLDIENYSLAIYFTRWITALLCANICIPFRGICGIIRIQQTGHRLLFFYVQKGILVDFSRSYFDHIWVDFQSPFQCHHLPGDMGDWLEFYFVGIGEIAVRKSGSFRRNCHHTLS